MAITVNHIFVSAKTDGADATQIQPSYWNNTLNLLGGVAGDILTYNASATSHIVAIAAVAAGSFLRSAGVTTTPIWSTLTIPNSAVQGDIVIATAANVLGSLAAVATGAYLRSAGTSTAPVWSTLVIPNAAATGDILAATSANTVGVIPAVAIGSFLRSAGVGIASVYSTTTYIDAWTAGDITIATGTNVIGRLALGSSGTILRSNGTAPAYTTATYPNTVTAGDIVIATGANVVGSLAVGASGTHLKSTGTAPAWSTVTYPDTFATGDVVIASGANTLSALTLGTTGKVLQSNGTTLIYSAITIPTSVTAGDILIASGANVVASLVISASAGAFLRSTGTAPNWSTLILPNAATVGDLLQATSTNTLAALAAVATGNALISGGVTTASSWGKVGLTTHVSGILPVANGGTGIAYFTAAGPTAARIYTFADSNVTIADLTTTQTLDQKTVTAATGSAAVPTLSFHNQPDIGFYNATTNSIGVSMNGVDAFEFDNTGSLTNFLIQDGSRIAFTAAGARGDSPDIYLTRLNSLVLSLAGNSAASEGAYLEMVELSAGAVGPAANKVRLYAIDSGGGKTKLMAIFGSGVGQQIAIEP